MVIIEEDNAVDISHITTHVGNYICPFCSIQMLAINEKAIEPDLKCPTCGHARNPITDQMKHSRTISSVITRERITEQESVTFDIVLENSGLEKEPEEEDNPMLQESERDDERMRRKGYKVSSTTIR
jgi:DNA-directed RNA polymerase subunit RPC12/RpoP